MEKPPAMPSTTEGRSVQVTDPREREAVKSGQIKGDVYSDDDVWADLDSLAAFRSGQSNG